MTTDNFAEWLEHCPHCCLRCGFAPVEGMKQYLLIHGATAKCVRCEESLVNQIDPYEKTQ